LHPGTLLGRYRIDGVVGEGSMGSVFRAHDVGLDRAVAIKVLRPGIAAQPEAAARFLDEARVLARMKDAWVPEIFDFVAASPAAPAYLVCELIEGTTLRQFLNAQRGRLLPETAALIVAFLADVLASVHRHGVVHRDIKPENVMLDLRRGAARIVLIDFGVAHVMSDGRARARGALMGSPAYMSPEQAAGEDPGPSSDQWGLGVLLYEMVTGGMPFAGRNLAAVVNAVALGRPRAPSQVTPYAGPAFDQLCMRCLAPAPSDRHPSLEHFAQQLREFCRAAGLTPDRASLHRLLSDPAGVDAAVRARAADLAVLAALRAAQEGRLARTLAELSRALAYRPAHAEAERVRRTLEPGGRWGRRTRRRGGRSFAPTLARHALSDA
jgi:serine/threonine protein kinase